ncbi:MULTISPECIES: polysaccharide deacetylase family protein [unclassified Sphingobium]|uniref:polysaccharide deacetylase family protein n=1 Tax=unclassified Sphingobium TaxID=2611147 RepID=UPI000A0739E6|nr:MULTISPECIES: polysaccharide deacetylase family protein [unclassified Sphingobium]WIW87072.1 polysaccharide deacetylase family protein [Sphingobium sp. V4]
MSAEGCLPALVISLDLEQAWGSEPQRIGPAELAAYHGARRAIPRILDLVAERNVALTWATVGLLFFDERDEMLSQLPAQRPSYADPALSAYARLNDVGRNEREDPLHFGRSLLRRIGAYPRQEIAGHSFSHYYALEDGNDPESFAADLAAASKAAASLGVELKSLVFPRNQVKEAYLPLCRSAGYESFRGTQQGGSHDGRPRRGDHLRHRAARLAETYLPLTPNAPGRPVVTAGLVNIAASHFLRPAQIRLTALDQLQRIRIRGRMRCAAQRRGICHIWWHPQNFGQDIDQNLHMLGAILDDYRRMADDFGMTSVTMAELASSCRRERSDAAGLAA